MIEPPIPNVFVISTSPVPCTVNKSPLVPPFNIMSPELPPAELDAILIFFPPAASSINA